jgi:hypothetical protein
MTKISIAFRLDPITLSVSRILPSKKIPLAFVNSRKFMQIRSSIEAIGVIEPLSVGPADPDTGHHVLLDGHVRLVALRELGFDEAVCLVADDDESYTYNSRVNRLSSIQEHHMMQRAIQRGVTPERLAEALNVDLRTITRKVGLLKGICTEVIEMLKDREFSSSISSVLRGMKPLRQVECVELMIAANNVTVAYAKAMLASTPASMLTREKKPTKITGLNQDQMAKMEREMSNVHGLYKMAEQSYGHDVLNLVLAKGYVAKLLANKAVLRFLRQRHPHLLSEFEAIAQVTSLD